MAQVRNGHVIQVGDRFKTIQPLTEKGIEADTECSAIDFNEQGYPVFSTKCGIIFVVSPYVTSKYLDQVS